MPVDRNLVASNVRAEIARIGVTRADVASALHLSYPSLHRRLRGEIAFDVDQVGMLAEFLKVPVATLLAGDAA